VALTLRLLQLRAPARRSRSMGGAIDHSLTRGLDNNGDGGDWKCPGGLRVIFESRPLLFFTAAITLFHFANAAMLPLVGERLSQGHKETGSLFIAACIIAAQAAMILLSSRSAVCSTHYGITLSTFCPFNCLTA
jgi:hypothetical protein